MKNIFKKLGILSLGLFMLIGMASPAHAYVSVTGYYRSNGTYVAPYVRSNPNSLKYDNYSYRGTGSLYNSSYYSSNHSTSWYTPSWSTDSSYYLGKSLYNSSSYLPSTMRSYNYGSLGSIHDYPSSSYDFGKTSRSAVDSVLYNY